MTPIVGAVLRKLGLLFAVLALFSIAGGHWAVLQTVAWAGMLHDYTQRTGSVTLAVEQTFDGAHPCELCREIAAAKQQEKAKEPTSAPGSEKFAKAEKSSKATAPGELGFACFQRVTLFKVSPRLEGILRTRADQPPTPPPRGTEEA